MCLRETWEGRWAHHAAVFVIIFTKAQRKVGQRLHAALHRHGLIVCETMLLPQHTETPQQLCTTKQSMQHVGNRHMGGHWSTNE